MSLSSLTVLRLVVDILPQHRLLPNDSRSRIFHCLLVEDTSFLRSLVYSVDKSLRKFLQQEYHSVTPFWFTTHA